MITREELEQRKDNYEQEREKLIAQVNMYLGAIQDIDYWIKSFDKSIKPVEPVTMSKSEGETYPKLKKYKSEKDKPE